MSRVAWFAGAAVAGAGLSAVVNLLTDGGAWWLWPLLALSVVASVVVNVALDRRASGSAVRRQRIEARGGAIEDSPQRYEGTDGPVSQEIRVGRKGRVWRSGQTFRRR